MGTKEYGQESIRSLKGADRVRLRPGVIFGSNTLDGATHSVFEIISNSVDEAKDGHGNIIDITYKKDGEITVADNGRGIPLDWNDSEQRFNWELIFCELYAGGKYDEESYGDSLGLNGLGACATQYASEFMDVEVYRDNTKYNIKFKKGEPVTKLEKVEDNTGRTGSIIKFKPDLEVFDEVVISVDTLIDILRRQAMLHTNVVFNLNYEGRKKITFKYPNGISEFLEGLVGEDKLTGDILRGQATMRGKDKDNQPEYDVKMDVAMTFSRDHDLLEIYHNSSNLEYGGVHAKAIRKGLVDAFTVALKESGMLKGNQRAQYRDIEDILVCIVSTGCLGSITSYENQTKKAVNNKFIEKALAEFIGDFITKWTFTDEEEAEKILKQIDINRKTRENSEAVRKKVFRKLTGNVDKLSERPKKFVDCDSKVIEDRELYIVEGDSALGSTKLARNSDFQAIMPVRGKIKNCLKASTLDVLKSEPISDLIKVLGCGVETRDRNIKDVAGFDRKKLRWGKIIICTDADIDGMQIRCLIITMIYKLLPTLLEEGLVYIAETPLYELEYKKKITFAYTEEEKDDYIKELGGVSGVKISRSKGLGENQPEMMSESTMHPDTRRLIQVKYDKKDKNLVFVMNALLGDDIENRRILISEYASELDEYDIG